MALKTRSGRIAVTKPNWQTAVETTYSFKTHVHMAFNGREQREALRETARMEIAFETMLREDEFKRHSGDLAGTGQDQLFYVANPWRSALTTAPTGVATITIDPMPFWAVSGAAVVVEDATQEEAGIISTVVGTTITLEANLTLSFATGARVRPAYQCRAQDQIELASPIATAWTGSVRYDVDPGVDPQVVKTIIPDQFEGRDVFLTKPNFATAPSSQWQSARRTMDSGRGRILTDSSRGFPIVVRQLLYTETSTDKAEELLAFFIDGKGKRDSFFMPSWAVDMRARVLASGTSLEIEGEDFALNYFGDNVFNCLYVRFDDGSYQINRIASMAQSGGHSVLTMTDPWAQNVPADHPISWCLRWRMATDILKLSWLTNDKAEATLSVSSLRNEAP